MMPSFIIISTIVYLFLTVITVLLGDDDVSKIKFKAKFLIFLALGLLYCGFIIIEKFDAAEREQKLQTQLDLAKEKIIAEQEKTNSVLNHLSLATLDFLHPSVYKDYPNFRLGLMWYWLGKHNEAIFHFQASLRQHSNHFASRYNLGILYVLKHQYAGAESLFKSILKATLSADQRRHLDGWLYTLSEYKDTKVFNVKDSTQWQMWRLP